MLNNKIETHLFIIWENARFKEAEIIADISQKFNLKKIFEVSWDRENFSKNLTSFYGTKLPKNSHKEEHCGNGKFLLIVVNDCEPRYENRLTSKGSKLVNSNLFDAKEKYRQLTGGGHKIHATNSIEEARHDLALLTGFNLEDFLEKYPDLDSNIVPLKRDLPVVTGWKSVEELFYILNETTLYVVLRNFDMLPKKFSSKEHGDIDFLVNNFDEITFITGAKKVFDQDYRVHCTIDISGQEVLFDFRYLGDGYYDPKIEEEILRGRFLNENKIYVPSDEIHFYSLLYHALIHKFQIADDYIEKFKELAIKLKIDDFEKLYDGFGVGYFSGLLDKWMIKNRYSYTKPIDKSVVFNENNIVSKNLITLLKSSTKEKLITFEIKLNKLILYLFQGILPNIFRIKIRLGGLFKIDISIGKPKDL